MTAVSKAVEVRVEATEAEETAVNGCGGEGG